MKWQKLRGNTPSSARWIWLQFGAQLLAFVSLVGSLSVSASVAVAQDYPSKPVRIVVPWPAGGGADTVARLVADKLAIRLGQPFVIQNTGGATGTIGTQAAAAAEPNGYTLLFVSAEHTINQNYFKKLPYDGARDFVAVGGVATQPFVVLAGAKSKIESLNDLLQRAKAAPGKLTFATWGVGSLSHLGMEFAKARTGADLLHVPYKGSAPAIADVIGGFVDTMMVSFTLAAPQAHDGNIKLLAATTPKRNPEFPGVPTFSELGFPAIQVAQWYAILAPAGTPKAIVDKLSTEIKAIVTSSDVETWMKPVGIEPFPADSSQLGKFVNGEIERWKAVMKEAKISQQ